MKKLSKLKLQDAKFMTDREMKVVIGGYGGSGTYDDPFELPGITVYGGYYNGIPPCSSGGLYPCSGKPIGEVCRRPNGKEGNCRAWPDGTSACRACVDW